MLQFIRNHHMGRLLGLSMLLVGLLGGSLVQAACQPGQMQEASLAYATAATFLQSQQWDQAIAQLRSAVDICSEHVDATRGLGDAYMGKGDFANAVLWYNKVVAIPGYEPQAGDYGNTAKAFAKQKKYKEARVEYMKAQKLAPDDCGILFNLGVMHYATGFQAQSVEVLQHALDVCPQYRDNILKQLVKSAEKAASKQQKAGNSAKAEYFRGLVSQYGGAAGGSTTYDLVKKKMDAQQYGEAAQLLEKMLAQNSDQPNAWLTLARVRDALGNKPSSIQAYQEYLQRKPADAKATGAMLQVMVEAGQCSQARREAEAALAKMAGQGAKNLAPVRFSYGMALECLGEFDTAKAQFQQVITSGNTKYAGPARSYMQRQDDLKAKAEYDRKKKAQQGG